MNLGFRFTSNTFGRSLPAFTSLALALMSVTNAADKDLAPKGAASSVDTTKPNAVKVPMLQVNVKGSDDDGKAILNMKDVRVVLDSGELTPLDASGRAQLMLEERPSHRLVLALPDGSSCPLELGKTQVSARLATVQLSRKEGKVHCELRKPK